MLAPTTAPAAGSAAAASSSSSCSRSSVSNSIMSIRRAHHCLLRRLRAARPSLASPASRGRSSSSVAAAAAAAAAPSPFAPAEPLPNSHPPLPPGTRVTIPTPDDWHLHLRDGAAMAAVAPHTALHFRRALIMPNLSPQPVTTVAAARAYRGRILAALATAADAAERAAARGDPGADPTAAARLRAFEPLMTLYLTDATPVSEVEAAAAAEAEPLGGGGGGAGGGGGGGTGGAASLRPARPLIAAFKLYPAGATTNSSQGVTGDLSRALPAMRAMADCGLPLCVHGEVTRAEVDVFDREAAFLRERLAPLLDSVPSLRVVLEHITTAEAAAFVLDRKDDGGGVAASVTPQHVLLNRNALLVGGVRPHAFCLPILKRERHRAAVLAAATLPAAEGGDRFFLGTDSAPHPRGAKETACGCAGVYSAPAALALYAAAFEQRGALADGRFAAFAGRNGAAFYGREANGGTVTLVRRKGEGDGWRVPDSYALGGDDVVVPMWAGQELAWRVEVDD